MRILIIAYQETAGVLIELSKGVMRISEHQVRVATVYPHKFGYQEDLLIGDDRSEFNSLIRSADVLHFNIHPPSGYSKVLPDNFDAKKFINDGGLIVQHFHGTILRSNRGQPIYPSIVPTADLISFIPKEIPCLFLPYPIPTDHPLYLPIKKEHHNNEIIISQSPSTSRTIGEYIDILKKEGSTHPCTKYPILDDDMKNTKTLLRSIEKLKSKYPVKSLIIRNCKYDESIRLKGGSDIFFDQLFLGIYGVSTAEAMSKAVPTICRLDTEVISTLNKVSKFACPIVSVDEDGLYSALERLIYDKEYRLRVSEKSRQWCIDVHDSKVIAKKYIQWLQKLRS